MIKSVSLLLSAVCVSGMLVMPAASQEARACALEDGKMVCAKDTKDTQAIFAAMANPASLAYFEDLRRAQLVTIRRDKREAFRRSLERNHRAMRTHARRQERKYRRGKLSAEEYQAVRNSYNQGIMTYRSAFNLYRETIWFDTRSPTQ